MTQTHLAPLLGWPRMEAPAATPAPLGWPSAQLRAGHVAEGSAPATERTLAEAVGTHEAIPPRGADEGGVSDETGEAAEVVSPTVDVSRETTPVVPTEATAETTPPVAASSAASHVSAEAEVSRETTPVEEAERAPIPEDETPLARQLAQDVRRRASLVGQRLPRPAECRILTVANQKGGVGKTTTTVNVAAALAQAGLRVLVVDIDPQGNASTALGIDHHAEVPSIYDVLVEGRALSEVITACPDVEGLYCAPATIDLAGAEIELVSLVARETRLRRALEAYLQQAGPDESFDYILIDCPPSLGLLTVNAFVAAGEVFIPIQCEYYALEGLSQLLQNIELIRNHLNPDLFLSTILLTMYDGRTRLSSQVAEDVREHFPDQVLRTTVPRSVRISEAPSHGETVLTYDPSSSGALSYLEAAGEIARRGAAGPDAAPSTTTGA